MVPASVKAFAQSSLSATKQNYVILLMSIIILLIRYALIESTIINSVGFFEEILKHIGISFFIGFIVIITIEQRSRAEQVELIENYTTHIEDYTKKLTAHINDTIFEKEFPDGVYPYIREKLMRASFFRNKTSVSYILRRPKSRDIKFWNMEVILLDIDYNYEVKNLSHKEEIYSINFSAETDGIQSNEKLNGELRETTLTIDGVKCTPEQMKSADDAAPDTKNHINYIHKVSIKSGETKRIQVKTSAVRLIADSELFRTTDTCDSARLTICYPSELKLTASAVHPDSWRPENDEPGMLIVSITKPLFPAHGFHFWWYPNDYPDNPNAI